MKFLEPKDAQNYSYRLSSWVRFSTRSLTLAPNEKKTLTVTIDKNELSPGGHYTSILAEVEQQPTESSVQLKGMIASLLFVRSDTGRIREEGSITSLLPLQDFFLFPHKMIFRFHNSGNVELTPRGTLSVYDPFKKLVVKEPLNIDSLITLPESIRRYDIVIPQNGTVPGIYKAVLRLTISDDKTITEEVTFFSLGSPFYIGIIATIITCLIAMGIIIRRIIRNNKKPHHSTHIT